MNWEVFLKNSHTAEWILNLSLQLLIVSISGWIIIKIWKPNSAPTRGGCYLAILISLAIVPLFSILFHTYKISWFQTSIPLATTQYNSKAAETSLDYDVRDPAAVKSPKTPQIEKSSQKSQDKSVMNRKFNLFHRDRVFIAINVFGIVWLIGILILLSRVIYGLIFLVGYVYGLVELREKRFDQVLESVKRIFGKKTSPKIFVTPSLSSPIAVGLRKPGVILPLNLSNNMTDEELRCVLFHELAHIYHYDHIVGLMQRILTSLYWWNPFVYFISAGFSISREEVSDNYAIKGLKNPRLYAENLLNLAEKTCLVSRLPATAGMADPHFSLEDRVRSILTKGRNRGTKLNPNYAFLLLIGSLILANSVVGMKGSFEHSEISGNEKGIRAKRISENITNASVNSEYGFKKTPLYRIKDSPGKNWREIGYDFNNQFAFDHSSGKASIVVGTIVKERVIKNAVNNGIFIPDPQAVELSFFYQRWLKRITYSRRWKDVMPVNEGKTTVSGSEAYWNIFEFAHDSTYLKNRMGLKSKIYFIEGNEYCFRIWLRCAKESFDDFINDFDRYVNTFEIIS